jgi:hypothetical protein
MTNGGHGFRSSELDHRIQQFFDKHLRGIPAEISSAAITVEPRK